MNKRLVFSLLGGGISITIATLGSFKVNDSVKSRKLRYWKQVNKTFSENLSEDFKKENYYLPLWEDNVSWKKQHDGLPSKYSQSFNPYERWPTPESFRNYCYDEAEKDKEVKDCNTSWGWCEHCVRSKDWD